MQNIIINNKNDMIISDFRKNNMRGHNKSVINI